MVLVSAIMPVYNGSGTLRRAVDSILSQTMTDWELIIVDDGSTDDSWQIIDSYNDERIRKVRLNRNMGRPYARNVSLEQAVGEYVATCDADDVSLPERFEQQSLFLHNNPSVGVVASQLLYFSASAEPSIRFMYPESSKDIALRFDKNKMAMPNASAMMRRCLLLEYGGYNPSMLRAQDMELFLRMHPTVKFRILSTPLVQYNDDTHSLALRKWWLWKKYDMYAVESALSWKAQTPLVPWEQFSKSWRVRSYVLTIGTLKYMHLVLWRNHRINSVLR